VGLEYTSGRLTVVTVGERLLNVSTFVTVETTVHGHGVRVGCRLGVPLHGNLTRRASIRAVVTRLAGLVRAHGPTGVLLIGSDGNQASVGRELALATFLLENHFAGLVVTAVAMTVFSGFSACNEGDKRSCAGRFNFELHCVRGRLGRVCWQNKRVNI
jgi:hypothetical protein